MGIINPRPMIRKGESRKIRSQLARHYEIMQTLISEGMSKEEASKEALKRMNQKEAGA